MVDKTSTICTTARYASYRGTRGKTDTGVKPI